MSVAASPSVAPQILIENASYGWTEELLDQWKARYHKDIFDMLVSASRGAAAVSRHRRDSFPSHNEVGGLFFDFEARCSAQASDSREKDCWISFDERGQQSTEEVASY